MSISSHPSQEFGHPIKYDPSFGGPSKRRSCTDIICLIVFIIFIACWIGIGIFAFVNGDVNAVLAPRDSQNLRCGVDPAVKNKPYLFFFDLTKCFQAGSLKCNTPQVCIDKCPSEYYFADEAKDMSKAICKSDSERIGENKYKEDVCAQWYLPSYSFHKRCIPFINTDKIESLIKDNKITDHIKDATKTLKFLSQAEQLGQNVVDDILVAWWKIAIGVGIAFLICVIYILLLRWFAAVMVWFSILGIVAALGFGIYMSAVNYLGYKNNPPDEITGMDENGKSYSSYDTEKNGWLALLIITCIVLIVILLILIFLRKRILLAVQLIKEGSRAVGSVTSSLFFPIFPWILQVGVIVFGIYVGLLLTTSGQPIYKIRGNKSCIPVKNDTCNPNTFSVNTDCMCKYVGMDNSAIYSYLQAFNVVAVFWSAFFVSAMGQMILASVFATWYFTRPRRDLPFFAVTSATGTVLAYHIGTLAFGSLIITICRIIRVILEYIDRKLNKFNNSFVKAVLCCMKCFFWCLEKFLKFINKNAYIMCAIHGKNFCSSARDAFMLLMRNIIRVWVLDKVTDFLFFISKLLITAGVTGLCYLFFISNLVPIDNTELNYREVPVVIIAVITYLIASLFFNVYSMAVDTLFLCFLEDCERNDGSREKPYYMSKNLMKIFGKKNKKD